MRRSRLLVPAAVLLVLAFTSAEAMGAQEASEAAAAPAPCSDPEFRQFDFWLGDWTVRNPAGQKVGTNLVSSQLGGCMLLEHWKSVKGHEGMSINYFDHRDGSWNQIFLDNTGNVGSWPPLKGALAKGVMLLESPEDAKPRTRWSWTLLEGGQVRQWAESSSDGGESWVVVWDSVYSEEAD